MNQYLRILKEQSKASGKHQDIIKINCDALFKLQEIDYNLFKGIDIRNDLSSINQPCSTDEVTVSRKKLAELIHQHEMNLYRRSNLSIKKPLRQ